MTDDTSTKNHKSSTAVALESHKSANDENSEALDMAKIPTLSPTNLTNTEKTTNHLSFDPEDVSNMVVKKVC